jgi:hypothetical protein
MKLIADCSQVFAVNDCFTLCYFSGAVKSLINRSCDMARILNRACVVQLASGPEETV